MSSAACFSKMLIPKFTESFGSSDESYVEINVSDFYEPEEDDLELAFEQSSPQNMVAGSRGGISEEDDQIQAFGTLSYGQNFAKAVITKTLVSGFLQNRGNDGEAAKVLLEKGLSSMNTTCLHHHVRKVIMIEEVLIFSSREGRGANYEEVTNATKELEIILSRAANHERRSSSGQR